MRRFTFTIKVRVIASTVVMLVLSMVVVVWYITSRNADDARKTGFAYAAEVAQSNAASMRQVILGGLSTARDMNKVLDATSVDGRTTIRSAARTC